MRWDLAELDRQMEHAELDIKIIELQTELALRNALYNIAVTAIEMQITNKTITMHSEYLHRITRRYYFGLASARSVTVAKNRLTMEESKLTNLQISHERNRE